MPDILVVDDEQEIADLVELYLKNEGYINVTTAHRRWSRLRRGRLTWRFWT